MWAGRITPTTAGNSWRIWTRLPQADLPYVPGCRVAAGVSELSPMPEDAESLRIQNALLREQLAKLEAQKQKLQRAIRELL